MTNDPRSDADTASEALRALAHATRHASDLDPAEVYDVLGSLANSALGQVLDQLAQWHHDNTDQARTGPGRHDALTATEQLRAAAALAEEICRAVDAAFNATARITWHPPSPKPPRRPAPRQRGQPDHGHGL